jgi:hypothetical protein
MLDHSCDADQDQPSDGKRDEMVGTCEQVGHAMFGGRVARVRRNLRGESGEQSTDHGSQIHKARRIRTPSQMVKCCLA